MQHTDMTRISSVIFLASQILGRLSQLPCIWTCLLVVLDFSKLFHPHRYIAIYASVLPSPRLALLQFVQLSNLVQQLARLQRIRDPRSSASQASFKVICSSA